MQLTLTRVPLEATLDLREAVLSAGHPGRPVVWPYDHDDDSRNYGVVDSDGRVVGCVSTGPKALPRYGEDNVYRFHSMAVANDFQNQGIGRFLLRSVVSDLAEDGAEVIWATARDSAVGFYERCGMDVVQNHTFVVEETGFKLRYIVLEAKSFDRVLRDESI